MRSVFVIVALALVAVAFGSNVDDAAQSKQAEEQLQQMMNRMDKARVANGDVALIQEDSSVQEESSNALATIAPEIADEDESESEESSSSTPCIERPEKDHQRLCDDVQQWINENTEEAVSCADTEALTEAKSLLGVNDACSLDWPNPEHHIKNQALLEMNAKVGARLARKLATQKKSVLMKMPEFMHRIEAAINCDVPSKDYCAEDVPCLTCKPTAEQLKKNPDLTTRKCDCPPPVPGVPDNCPCRERGEDDTSKPGPCLCPAGKDCPCLKDAILETTLPARVLPHAHCSQLNDKKKCDARKHDDVEECFWYKANPDNIPPILEPYCGHPLVVQLPKDKPLVSHCTAYTECGPCDLENQCQWDHIDDECVPKPSEVRLVDKIVVKKPAGKKGAEDAEATSASGSGSETAVEEAAAGRTE